MQYNDEDDSYSRWEGDGGAAINDPEPNEIDPIEPWSPEPVYA